MIVDIGAIEDQLYLPDVINNPVGGTRCAGDSITLVVETADTAGFQWQKDGSDIPGATAPVLTLTQVTPADQGNYRCKIFNSYGSVYSEASTVFVLAQPYLQVIDRDTWVEPGKETRIKTYAEGSNIVYQWKKNGHVIPGEILPEYSFTPNDSSCEGYYSCVVSIRCKSV